MSSYYEKVDGIERCIDDEIPFGLPNNWAWERLSTVAYNIYAGGDKPKDFSSIKDANRMIPVIANGISNEGILGYTSTATAKEGTITVAGRGTIGFSLYRPYRYCPVVRLIVIEQSHYLNPLYLQYFLEAFPEKSLGTSIPQLTVPMLKPKLISIPPYKEQQRIVEQIEKVFFKIK